MQKRQLPRQIARLPDMTTLQVEAVLEVAAELWTGEMQRAAHRHNGHHFANLA